MTPWPALLHPKPRSKAKASKRCRIIISRKRQTLLSLSHSQDSHKAHSRKQQATPMEEMMTQVMMMNVRTTHEITPTSTSPQDCKNNYHDPPICQPTWKLYENPLYFSIYQKPLQVQDSDHQKIHCLHLPVSSRKLAASFWDLAFIKPAMESELDKARAQIVSLKEDLEIERKARRKLEGLNKKLTRELSEGRKGRKNLEKICQELAKEISSDKAEISRMKKEFEEERKMLRTADVIREERVQMKLAEAKILLEEKLSELETARKIGTGQPESSPGLSNFKTDSKIVDNNGGCQHATSFQGKLRLVLGEKKLKLLPPSDVKNPAVVQRTTEAENPHIRRGIKGFVEFSRVVKAIGCRSGKNLGSKLECQKAQLKILLKQKGTGRINGLITS